MNVERKMVRKVHLQLNCQIVKERITSCIYMSPAEICSNKDWVSCYKTDEWITDKIEDSEKILIYTVNCFLTK